MGILSRSFAFALACALVHPATAAAAPEAAKDVRDMARTLATRGHDLLQEGRVDEAIEVLERANEIYRAPTIGLYLARAYEKRGSLLRAVSTYEAVLAMDLGRRPPPEFTRAQGDARAELDALQKKVPTIDVAPSGFLAPVELALDGATMTETRARVDPGRHRVRATGADGRNASKEVDVAIGATVRVDIEAPAIEAAAPASPPPNGDDGGLSTATTVAIPFFVVGGLALGAGIFTGALASGKASDFEAACPSEPCPASSKELYDDADSLATTSNIGFIAGGALLATGAVLLIVDLATDGGDETEAWLAPGRGGMKGRF